MPLPLRILFVCTGNICRSPTAEAVLRQQVELRGWSERLQVDSAGTHPYHVGDAPDARSCDAAHASGYTMRHLVGRQVEAADFERFDLLLAMDNGHRDILWQRAPINLRERIQLFLPYAGIHTPSEVADPYYGPLSGFDDLLLLIERGCAGLLTRLGRERHWVDSYA